jgi:uncharacterized protein YmfQ (DUF2313 family)
MSSGAGADLRAAQQSYGLIADAFPATTNELLPEWEKSLGLPDPYLGPDLSIDQRRAHVAAKFTLRGGQTPAYFISVAAALGYTITIKQFAPFRAGRSHAGVPAGGAAWAFAWQVNAPLTTIQYFRAGKSAAGDPLRT